MNAVKAKPLVRRDPVLARTLAALRREQARKRRLRLLQRLERVFPW